MDVLEIEEALETFCIIVDSREQATPKAKERYSAFGVPYEKGVLDFGDYCGQVTLPEGKLYDTSRRITPVCCIERKMSLDELASCFTRQRDRFQREFDRSKEAGAKVYLLTEGGSWEAIWNHRYRSKFHPEAFAASLLAWSIRYDLTPIFCKPGTSGRIIKEILYRDIKERLYNGEFE